MHKVVPVVAGHGPFFCDVSEGQGEQVHHGLVVRN